MIWGMRLRPVGTGVLGVICLLAVAACAGPPAVRQAPSPTPPPTAPAFDTERVMATIRFLAGEVGTRPAGSEASRRAAEYLAGQLRALGYRAETQPFTFRDYVDRGSDLRIVGGRPVSANTLRDSPAGSLRAPLAAAGLGRPEDVAAADLPGKIALVQRGAITFREKVRNAAAAGAIDPSTESATFAGAEAATFAAAHPAAFAGANPAA